MAFFFFRSLLFLYHGRATEIAAGDVKGEVKMEIVKHLAGTIGERWAGRRGAAEAAAYLYSRFASLPLEVEQQDFPFLGWEIDQEPRLEILEPDPFEAAVALMEYSGSTLPKGIEGQLRTAGIAKIVPGFLEWPRYEVINSKGEVEAYLIVHVGLAGWEAPPIPLMNPRPFYPYPMAIMAEADHRRIQRWVEQRKPIRVRFRCQGHAATFRGRNVVATLPGRSEQSVVFCAHLDSAYKSPGANNNAGGVQALYDLALTMSKESGHRLTYRFLACDACEWGFLGSRFFLQNAEDRGYMENILAGINIDTVASGDSFFFLAWPDSMHRRAERVVDQLNLRKAFKQVEYLDRLAGSDHYSFIEAGIPAAEILFWPCEVYKLPEDDMNHVNETLIRRSVEIAAALVKTFEEESK